MQCKDTKRSAQHPSPYPSPPPKPSHPQTLPEAKLLAGYKERTHTHDIVSVFVEQTNGNDGFLYHSGEVLIRWIVSERTAAAESGLGFVTT